MRTLVDPETLDQVRARLGEHQRLQALVHNEKPDAFDPIKFSQACEKSARHLRALKKRSIDIFSSQ